jgi:hypothetical protein
MKNEKVHHFYTFMLIIFLYEFFTLFSTDLKSASNSAFFDSLIKMSWKNICGGHTSTFYQLWILTHTKRQKKRKIYFFNVNQNKLYFQFWFRTSKVLKSFHSKILHTKSMNLLFSSLISLFSICFFMSLIFCTRIDSLKVFLGMIK